MREVFRPNSVAGFFVMDLISSVNFLFHVVLTSLWCLGFYIAFDSGMILGWLRPEKKYWLTKPLYDCPPCMGSLHGFVAFFLLFGTMDFRVVPFIFCVSGLNWLLSSIAE